MEIPVLLIAYNRADLTRSLIDELRRQGVSNIFFAVDGPKSSFPDSISVNEVRRLESYFDWDCVVYTHFQDVNLGCKRAVISAIDWFFSCVNFGIILEDDIMPTEAFFKFCKWGLQEYQKHDQVFMISGFNPIPGKGNDSNVKFSRYPQIWGWATWADRWRLYDGEMIDYFSISGSMFDNLNISAKEKDFWKKIFADLQQGKIDTWDYQILYTYFKYSLLTVLPNVNLVSNVGIGDNSTHTSLDILGLSKVKITAEIETFSYQFPNSNELKFDKKLFTKIYNPMTSLSNRGLLYLKNKLSKLFFIKIFL
jgi:hypothetical protein